MRYSRMEDQRPPEKRGGAKFIVITLIILVAAAVYLIGASKVGSFLNDKVVEPIAMAFSSETKEPQRSEDTENTDAKDARQVSFYAQPMSFYALQAGVFSDEENARKYASELKNKGGAGYVLKDGNNNYRVLISGYGNKEDAESVSDRLKSSQGMETSVFEISGKELSFSADADELTANSLKEAEVNSCVTALSELSLKRDRGEISVEEAKESLNEVRESSLKIKETMEKAGKDDLAVKLAAFYLSVAEAAAQAEEKTGEVEFSSALKCCYLSAAQARAEMG